MCAKAGNSRLPLAKIGGSAIGGGKWKKCLGLKLAVLGSFFRPTTTHADGKGDSVSTGGGDIARGDARMMSHLNWGGGGSP